MGPMQHSLTTATLFKSQKILFKARALGSNLIHRRLSTSQLPILDPPSPVTWFTSFLSCPPTPYGFPPSFARFCDTRISSYMAESVFAMRLVNWRSVTCYTDQNFREKTHFGVLNLFTSEKKVRIKLQDVYQHWGLRFWLCPSTF